MVTAMRVTLVFLLLTLIKGLPATEAYLEPSVKHHRWNLLRILWAADNH